MKDYCVRGADLVLPDRILPGRDLSVRGGLIADLGDDPSKAEGLPEIDGRGRLLAPAPIEIHFHGVADYSVDQADADLVEKITAELASRGTAAFIPGFAYDEAVVGRCVRELLRKPSLRDRVPGIYLESPFVSLEKRGGIHPHHVKKPDTDLLKRILDLCQGTLRLMTVAPELEGIDRIIDLLFENGVIPCLGHSNATARRGLEAARRGKMGMTHLFNAMSPISHKDPGIALVPFLDRDIHFELNGDGVHVAPEILRLCHQSLNRERLILISDAVISAGKSHGRYPFFGRTVVSDGNGVRCAETGTLVGSNLLILDGVRNYAAVTGAPVAEAMRMATLNPFRFLGLDGARGSIAAGKKADLVLLDGDLRVVRTLFS
jgi:N-acetylglucosamine-6-phosphate deacetylase